MTHVCMSAALFENRGGCLRSRHHCKAKRLNDQRALDGFEIPESACSCIASGYVLNGPVLSLNCFFADRPSRGNTKFMFC